MLVTYDEVVFADGYYTKSNNKYYLYDKNSFFTMSTAGIGGPYAEYWSVHASDGMNALNATNADLFRPILNLPNNLQSTSSGTSADPFVVQ